MLLEKVFVKFLGLCGFNVLSSIRAQRQICIHCWVMTREVIHYHEDFQQIIALIELQIIQKDHFLRFCVLSASWFAIIEVHVFASLFLHLVDVKMLICMVCDFSKNIILYFEIQIQRFDITIVNCTVETCILENPVFSWTVHKCSFDISIFYSAVQRYSFDVRGIFNFARQPCGFIIRIFNCGSGFTGAGDTIVSLASSV